MLAIVRPDAWNLPLFLHVLGALVLVGTLVLAATFLFAGRGAGALTAARAGYRTLLVGALPSYVVMRVAAQWVASEEGVDDSDAAWIGIGYMSTEGGLLLLLGATVAAGLAVRRARLAAAEGVSGRGIAAASYIVAFLIVLYLAVIVVMATKPV
jgi:hypothetical protein